MLMRKRPPTRSPTAPTAARSWRFFEHSVARTLDEPNERYPRRSRVRHVFAKVLDFYEGAGVLVSCGLLHEDVLPDARFALELVWSKVRPIIETMQETLHPPRGRNVAWLAMRWDMWSKTRRRAKLEVVPPE